MSLFSFTVFRFSSFSETNNRIVQRTTYRSPLDGNFVSYSIMAIITKAEYSWDVSRTTFFGSAVFLFYSFFSSTCYFRFPRNVILFDADCRKNVNYGNDQSFFFRCTAKDSFPLSEWIELNFVKKWFILLLALIWTNRFSKHVRFQNIILQYFLPFIVRQRYV